MLYRVRPEFVHGQADLLGSLRIQFQFGPFNENRIVTQIMEGGELASDKVSNVRAVPIVLDEEIVSFSKRTEAPAEARIELIGALSLSSHLVCHALHNEKKILRSVRQLMHDEINVLLMPSAHGDIRAQCQARHRNANHECEQKKEGLVEAAADKRSRIRYRTPHRKARNEKRDG